MKGFKTVFVLAVVVSFVSVISAAVYIKLTYERVKEKGLELIYLLNRNDIESAHALFDKASCEIFTAAELKIVDMQMDRLIGKAGKAKWAGTFKILDIVPLTVACSWTVNYSLSDEHVVVTMSFVKRRDGWRVAGLWYDSDKIRKTPLLVAIRFTNSLNKWMFPKNSLSRFISGKGDCYLWTMWQGLNGNHRVTHRWFNPEGKLYYDYSYNVEGKPMQKNRVVWSRIDCSKNDDLPAMIEDRSGANRGKISYGKWRVEILLDGACIDTEEVDIQ